MVEVTIDPLTRIEGHLKIRANVDGGKVTDAWSSGMMYRGLENILIGRDPRDASIITQRACGVCPVAHATASIRCLDDAFDASVPENAKLIRNIILGSNNIMSHATHFYALWAPDLANPVYKDILEAAGAGSVYNELSRRFAAFTGSSWIRAVMVRKKLHEIIAIFGGKMPHHMTYIPGGVTVRPDVGDIVKAYSLWLESKSFVEEHVLGCSVDRWLENRSLDDVVAWLDESETHANSDIGLLIRYGGPIEDINLGLHAYGGYGAGECGFLSYGAFYEGDGRWLKPGFYDGDFNAFDPEKVTEYIAYSWYSGYTGGKHPNEGFTEPIEDPDFTSKDKYTWMKAPRYNDMPTEVGPLARMINDRDPLVLDLATKLGANVYTRTLARLHEAVRVLAKLKEWLLGVDIDGKFYEPAELPSSATGVGLTEAPRGSLGHWASIKDGKLERYQLVVPTTWNCSPRDDDGKLGAVEQAVVGTPVTAPDNPIEILHTVRSFDPCIACAVHTVDLRDSRKKYEVKVV